MRVWPGRGCLISRSVSGKFSCTSPAWKRPKLPLPQPQERNSRFQFTTTNGMKSELTTRTLQDLANLYLDGKLPVSREYQRGTKWRLPQKQALVDSLLRGYQIPLFYVHIKKTPSRGDADVGAVVEFRSTDERGAQEAQVGMGSKRNSAGANRGNGERKENVRSHRFPL